MEDTIRRLAAVLVEISKKNKQKKKKRAEVGQREGSQGDAICKGALRCHGRRMGRARGGGYKGNTGEISGGAPGGQWRSSPEVLSSAHGGSVPTDVRRLA